MTKLTTHVLDVYSGKPGKGILVELFHINNSERKKITSVKLNNDGRANSPLVEGENFAKGKYELVFYIGDYFKDISSTSEVLILDLPKCWNSQQETSILKPIKSEELRNI